MLEVSNEAVYQAIAAFSSSDFHVSSNAAKWLEEFRKSILAWSIADQILGEGGGEAHSFDACLMAAQTIRQKILSNFRELPQGSYDSLRDSLINHLQLIEIRLGRKSNAIVTQLAAAIADLYLQVPHWDDSFLDELLGRLIKERVLVEVAPLVGSVLKVLPEEMQNRHLRISRNRRSTVEKQLARKTGTVITLLESIASMAGNDLSLQIQVISCLASWMSNSQCPSDVLANSPLIHSVCSAGKINRALQQSSTCQLEVHNAAADCVVNALYLAENLKVHKQLANVLQNGVYATQGAFQLAIQEEDHDKIQNYTRIYCELCETLLPEIVTNPGTSGFGDLKSLDLLLLIDEYHDYTIVETSLNLWYRLSEYLYQLDEGEFEILRPSFLPYVKRFILALNEHCRLDSDMEGTVDRRSEIATFRKKACETIKDVAFICGSMNLLNEMIELLRLRSNDGWDRMESTLYIISCFIHNITENEDVIIPQLLRSIFSLPASTHPMLLSTSAELLGNLQDWLNYNTDYLVLAAQWLISLGGNAGLMGTLANALENLCEKGYRHMSQYFDQIVSTILHIEAAPMQQRVEGDENPSLCLLRAATHLLNDRPGKEILPRLEQLCLPRLQYLEKIASLHSSGSSGPFNNEGDKENVSAGFADDRHLMLCLDGLAAIFRVLTPWQNQQAFAAELHAQQQSREQATPPVPWAGLVARIWLPIATILDDYKASARVVEHACRTVRFLVRSMGSQSLHFIEQLVTVLLQIYNEHPHSCFLYLASILTDEHGSIAAIQEGLLRMLKVLTERSFTLIRDAEGLKNHPDTVDDLFRLAIRFVQRAPAVFFHDVIATNLLQAAILGLELEHVDANKSVVKFISEIIDIASEKNIEGTNGERGGCRLAAQSLILAQGELLTRHCITSAIFHLPTVSRGDVADILFQLKRLNSERLTSWLTTALEGLPHDSGLAPTMLQLNEFKEEVVKAEKSYVVGNAIRDLAKQFA